MGKMTVKELYVALNKTGDQSTNSYQEVISTFECNQDLILNTNTNSPGEEYVFSVLFIAKYAIALFDRGRYQKALLFFNKVIPLFEDESIFEDVDFRNKWYTYLRFDRGAANYYINNFAEAKADFIWLTQFDPDNRSYKLWMRTVEKHRLDKLSSWMIYIQCVLIGFFYFVPKEEHTLRWFYLNFQSIVFVSFLVISFSLWIKKKQIKALKS